MSLSCDLIELIQEAEKVRASDLHIEADHTPIARIDGRLEELSGRTLGVGEIAAALAALDPEGARLNGGSIDTAASLESGLRLRIHVSETARGPALAVRLLPARIPSLGEIGVGPEVMELAHIESGLVAVCGTTGSGKSTTIAALVDAARAQRALHVVTIEDPVEYLYAAGSGVVNQREIGTHTPGFAPALRDALRADPDVIVVGELRDAETIELALVAAETGHAVFTSVHATSCAGAVDRLVHALPASRWDCVRAQLAGVLEGVVHQELRACTGGPGRYPINEVLRGIPAVRQVIRDGKTHQIPSIIEVSAQAGMLSVEASIARGQRRAGR